MEDIKQDSKLKDDISLLMDIKPYYMNKNIFTKEQIRHIQYTFEKEMLKTIN